MYWTRSRITGSSRSGITERSWTRPCGRAKGGISRGEQDQFWLPAKPSELQPGKRGEETGEEKKTAGEFDARLADELFDVGGWVGGEGEEALDVPVSVGRAGVDGADVASARTQAQAEKRRRDAHTAAEVREKRRAPVHLGKEGARHEGREHVHAATGCGIERARPQR